MDFPHDAMLSAVSGSCRQTIRNKGILKTQVSV
jgi:hypothetical protein